MNIGTLTRVEAVVGGYSERQSPSCSFCVQLFAVETNSVSGRQMTQNYLNVFDELVAFSAF